MIVEFLGRNLVLEISRWYVDIIKILKVAQRTKLGKCLLIEFTFSFYLLVAFGNFECPQKSRSNPPLS